MHDDNASTNGSLSEPIHNTSPPGHVLPFFVTEYVDERVKGGRRTQLPVSLGHTRVQEFVGCPPIGIRTVSTDGIVRIRVYI